MYKIGEMDSKLFASIGAKYLSLYVGSVQDGRLYTYKTLGIATQIDPRTLRDNTTGKTHIGIVNLGRITKVLGVEFYNLVMGDFLGISNATETSGDKADANELHQKISYLNTSFVENRATINHTNWHKIKPEINAVVATGNAVMAMYDDKYN